jgi:hypothetical protein
VLPATERAPLVIFVSEIDHGGHPIMFYVDVERDMIIEWARIMCAFFRQFIHLAAMAYKWVGWEKGRRQARCLATSVGFLRLILCGNVDVGYLGFGMARMCEVG